MIREIGISLLALACFGLVLWWGRLVAATHRVVEFSLAGLMSMLDSGLTDAAKEVAVRRAGLRLMGAAGGLLWRFAAAVALASAPILVADGLGVAPRDSVVELMLRTDYLIVVTVVATVATVAARRWRTPAGSIPTVGRYSTADRFFHAVAFSSPRVLRAAARMEERLLSSAYAASGPPIFVTSLARGGTTAVLNALHDVPGVATHTYRDMPFLTAPNLWYQLSGGKRRRVDRHERAHGDGLEIDLDSPEAFEEVVWKMFWPEKYRANSIALWRASDRKPEAERFLEEHMTKVIGARRRGRDEASSTARYCSKNNTNLARIPLLAEAYPGCRIVVPVRRPACHAASLRRQHQNFLKLQADDDFVARYMRDIGHFEFGKIHRPIEFPGFDAERLDPETDDYWMSYWIHAFREILDHGAECLVVTQDSLRSSPQETMTELCDALDLPDASLQFASYFRSSPDVSPEHLYDPRLHDEATALYRELDSISV